MPGSSPAAWLLSGQALLPLPPNVGTASVSAIAGVDLNVRHSPPAAACVSGKEANWLVENNNTFEASKES